MSRGTARAGTAAWLGSGQVAGLNAVYTSFPKRLDGQAFTAGQPPGTASGAVAVVFIAGEVESRLAIGGEHGGWKRIDYTIQVHIFHRSTEPDAQAAMDSFDGVVEALKVRLRADRTMGGVFWQEGELRLSGEYGEPQLLAQTTETWGQITFEATEMVAT